VLLILGQRISKISNKMKKSFKTFNEWSEECYLINKGSKATWFGKVAKFSKNQVSKKQENRHYSIFDNYDPREDDFGAQSDVFGDGCEDWISDSDFGDN
jgi:hypothetical protein